MAPRQILIGLAYIGWTTRSPTARYGCIPAALQPLALFRAARVDYPLHRLFHSHRHRSGALPKLCDLHELPVLCRCLRPLGPRPHGLGPHRRRRLRRTWQCCHEQCSPRRRNVWRCPWAHAQMPAFHLVESGYRGTTMINIGTGPSNARTITDHVAVLRPHAWLDAGTLCGPQQLAEPR